MARLVEGFIAVELSFTQCAGKPPIAHHRVRPPKTRKGRCIATAEIADADGDIIGISRMDTSQLHSLLWHHQDYVMAVGKVLNAQKIFEDLPHIVADFQLDPKEAQTPDGEVLHQKIITGSIVGVSLGYDFDPGQSTADYRLLINLQNVHFKGYFI